MKTISLAVSESDYEVFRQASRAQHRPIAQLIREAMALYRTARLQERPPLMDLPVLTGHRSISRLPDREELYDELFAGNGNPTE